MKEPISEDIISIFVEQHKRHYELMLEKISKYVSGNDRSYQEDFFYDLMIESRKYCLDNDNLIEKLL